MEVDKLPYKDLVALAKSLDVPNAGQTARPRLIVAVNEKLAAGVQPKPPPAETKAAAPADLGSAASPPPAQPTPPAVPAPQAAPSAKAPEAPPVRKAEPPVDDTPKCVRVLKSAWIEKDGRKTQVHLRDVFSGEFAAFLWKTYPKLVERYPIAK